MKFHFQTSILVLLIGLIGPTKADSPAKTNQYQKPWIEAIYACMYALSTDYADYTFGYNLEGAKVGYYVPLCSYDPKIASMMVCAADLFNSNSSRKFNRTIDRYVYICKNYAEVNITSKEIRAIYENGTNYLLENDPSVNYTEIILYQPIRANKTLAKLNYAYYNAFYFQFDRGSFLAGMLNLYFVMIFVIFGVGNLIKRIGFHRRFNNKFINWYRANISLPSTFNGKHTDSWVCFKIISTLIPTRVESIVVFGFICLNVLLTTFHYDVGYTMSGTKGGMLSELIADRTGLLSFGLIPLLIILAGRNNILTTLTGIPYTSMIVYHKWVARLMWIHAMIHSACWTYAEREYLASEYGTRYWRWGAVATVAGGVILFQAFHFFRNLSYEWFLFIHIVLAIFFIIGCWWHCYDLGWLEWIYTSWAVWLFDRLIRVIRMSVYGVHKAEVVYVGDDTFRVEVPYNKFFDPFPGSFAYLYFITPTLFWQSHPFTLLESVHKDQHICFYIKVKAGLTKRIQKQLDNAPDGTKAIRVCVEGPYGHRAPTDKYNKALFYAGGNGVPGPYAHVMDLSKRQSASKQEIKFLWVIRNIESLLWFSTELSNLARNTHAQLDIYITGMKGNPALLNSNISNDDENAEKKDGSSSETGSDNEKKGSNSETGGSDSEKKSHHSEAEELIRQLSDRITFHYQRPDVDALILKEFTEETGPSVSVMSCGPPKMVDQIRASVAQHLQKSKGRVDLYEELQVW